MNRKTLLTLLGIWAFSVLTVSASEDTITEDITPEATAPCPSPSPSTADSITALVADEGDTSPTGTRTPLILIHGLYGNRFNDVDTISSLNRAEWTSFLGYFYASDLPSRYKIFRFHYVSNRYRVWRLAQALRNKIDNRIRRPAGDPYRIPDVPFVIVAHSMGGLVARSYMQEHSHTAGRYCGQKGGERVLKLITLATPHHGSPAANVSARNTLFLQTGSPITWRFLARAFDLKYWPSLAKFDQAKPNRSDLRWDNFDRRMIASVYNRPVNKNKNKWLIALNTQSNNYDHKTIAYYGYIDPADTTRIFFSDPVLGPFRILFSGDILFDPPNSAGLLALSGVLGVGLSRHFPPYGRWTLNDGIVPIGSAALNGHVLYKRVECPGYDHYEMRDSSIELCANGLTLFESLRNDLNAPSVVQYLSTTNGDPGIPGDGIVVSSLPFAGFTISPSFSFNGVTNGITFSAFFRDSIPGVDITDIGLDLGMTPQPPFPAPPCIALGVRSPNPPVLTPPVNGVVGIAITFTQEQLEDLVPCPGLTAENFFLGNVLLFRGEGFGPVNDLDAFAVGFGENVFPTE